MKNLLFTATALGFISGLMGCASMGPTTVKKAGTGYKETVFSGTYNVRDAATASAMDCPASPTGWIKEKYERLMVMANGCAQSSKSERLEQIGQVMAQQDHQRPWGAFFLSVAYEQKKDYRRSLWMIDLASKKSEQALFSYQKGRVLWALGEYSMAVKEFEKAIAQNRQFTDAQLFLAQLYFRDQNWAQAEKYFTAILDDNASHLAATIGMAETFMMNGKTHSAIELYEKAAHLSPRHIPVRVKLAQIYEVQLKNYDQALNIYRRIQAMMTESRQPAEVVPFDVKEKIKRLEGMVQPATPIVKKVSENIQTQGIQQ